MLPPPFLVSRKREVDLREVTIAILYLLRSGCTWWYLPHDFPQWTTVYSAIWYFIVAEGYTLEAFELRGGVSLLHQMRLRAS